MELLRTIRGLYWPTYLNVRFKLSVFSYLVGSVCSFPALSDGWNTVFDSKTAWVPPLSHPIEAYSEFMPAPSIGARPYPLLYETKASLLQSQGYFPYYNPQDPHYFFIPSFDEVTVIRPGLIYLMKHFLKDLSQLSKGETPGGGKLKGIPKSLLENNPYFPDKLRGEEAIVSILPITLSMTQNDQGQTPWTVFGGTMASYEEVFWKSLKSQSPREWLCKLIHSHYAPDTPCKDQRLLVYSNSPELPAELTTFLGTDPRTAKFLVTFQPFRSWPEIVKKRYRQKRLVVVPHPLSLIFQGSPIYRSIAERWPEAQEIPLLFEFSKSPRGPLRVLNTGPLAKPRPDSSNPRRFRFQKVTRENSVSTYDLLFNTSEILLGLYGKPLAKNSQLWKVTGYSGELILNGPRATAADIETAKALLHSTPHRTYFRDYFPAIKTHGYELKWVRPVVSVWNPRIEKVTIDSSLMGEMVFTKDESQLRLEARLTPDLGLSESLTRIQDSSPNTHSHTTRWNVKKLVLFSKLLGQKLDKELVSSLLTPTPNRGYSEAAIASIQTDRFLKRLKVLSPAAAQQVSSVVSEALETSPISPLTFSDTVLPSSKFEKQYWNWIVDLTESRFVHKNNADCTSDNHCDKNHLDGVLTFLEQTYSSMGLKTFRHSFEWKSDFDILWWGGKSQTHSNLIVRIPGNRSDEVVILADHYDTAYMEDVYDGRLGKDLKEHRHAAQGADDNHSGTSALLEAARALQILSQTGKLKRDIWLIHLTGEEFPADCLGARALVQFLVEKKPILAHQPNPRVIGSFILDMIAHNTDRDGLAFGSKAPSIYQIAPGEGERSAQLALTAFRVNQSWNASSSSWNTTHARKLGWERFRYARNAQHSFSPPIQGEFPVFRSEIRPNWHFASALYNTDAQIFSDAGIPVVLFMENYDINRKGYHDSEDTLENIDLDYGAGLSRIAIETVAQTASQ